jgi:hypothetical protein
MSRNADRFAWAAGSRVLALGCFSVLAAALATASVSFPSVSSASSVDYADYAGILTQFVRPPRVDYARLVAGRAALDRAVAGLNTEAARGEPSWPREERLAFWINAYNVLTLQAIVNHYPIRGGWFSRGPSPSIRQIPGVWTSLKWPVAGRSVTLDDIEHRILRPEFAEPRVHFAINCASIGCPPLAATPYVAATLSDALDAAARTYLASPQGVKVTSRTLGVTSIFDWYGDDFVAQYASLMPGDRPAKLRAILAVVSAFGPPAAAELARAPDVSLRFLDYDWRLNDTGLASGARTSRAEQ